MSLNDYLARVRAETNPRNEVPLPGLHLSATPRTPEKQCGGGLLLRCWNREIWVLPWTHFMEAHFETCASSGAESMRLVFGKREVALRGRNLAGLMEPVARQALGEIRETPEAHMTPADATGEAPVAWEIRVRERACAK